jgi:serine/threonine-protein kinase HipA
MNAADNVLEVWLDCELCPPQMLGTLSHDRGAVRFTYDEDWLKHPLAFAIDPALQLDEGVFHPRAEVGNFGIFLDSSPDRWGQTLMKRREALQAKDEGRNARVLHSWDFLKGVQDVTRQGALRFRLKGTADFLANEALGAPPVTNLAELADIAGELTRRDIHDLDKLRRWLAVLVAPGASLGGARPKANFLEKDGSFWIAKFPAHQDDRDIGAWEGVVRLLAVQAKVDVPEGKVARLRPRSHHTFCVKRFDRVNGKRRFYASAMTLLGKQDNDEGTSSYIELAEFLANNGDPEFIEADLAQLFRRVAFNIAIGNRDDHLRNHGFLLGKHGWRLAPAFDVNPNIDKDTHALNIDVVDNRPSLDTVLGTAEYYRLTRPEGAQIVEQVAKAVDRWTEAAKLAGISAADIAIIQVAFSAHADYRTSRG